MNAEEVLKLIDAGFSADEIRGMQQATPEPEKKEPENEPGAASDKQVPEPAPSPEVTKLTEEISKLTDQIKTIQDANIKNANSGSSNVGDPVQDVIDSFLKEL